jgi:hypothetical protein
MNIFGEFIFIQQPVGKNPPQGSDCFSFEESFAETAQQ